MNVDRRRFLRRAGLAGAGAAALAAGLPRPPALADEALAPFVHGVASGDPQADRVMLWTRVTPPRPQTVTVRWTVARDPALSDVVAAGTARTDGSRDHTVKVDATGLSPATTYYYAFEALGRRSLVGRTRTAPAGGTDRLRLGVVSCSNYTGGYFNAYALLAQRADLDAIVHLGDYLYEYGNGTDRYGPTELRGARDHRPSGETVTLAQYRTRHAQYKLDPDLRRCHQLFPFVTVWDDHESANDSWSGGAENHDGDEGSWQRRKAESQRAYAEWMPTRTPDPAVIYRSLQFGDLVDLIMLDTRLEGRDEQVGGFGATVTEEQLDDPDRQLYSPAQRRFLLDGLSASTARFRLIGQQVMLAQLNAGGLPDLSANPDSPDLLRDGGNAINPDQWDGYVAERERLLRHLADGGIGNVAVLTGDIHTSWAADLTPDPYDPAVYNALSGAGALGGEFICPSVTSTNFETLPPGTVRAAEAAVRADNPHIKYVDLDAHGYVVVDVTPERVQADWWNVDTVLTPSDGETHAASWQLRDGAGHIEPAPGPSQPRSRMSAAPPPMP